MNQTRRALSLAASQARALVVLMALTPLITSCGESATSPNGEDGAAVGADVLDVADSADAVTSDEVATVDVDEVDLKDTASEISVEDAQDALTDLPDPGEVVVEDVSQDDTTISDGEPLDASKDADVPPSEVTPEETTDTAIEEVDPDEPCVPGEPCTLEAGWDCVEGICTSLQTCAPTPIPGCCTSDLDCANLDPPNACASFVCEESVCMPVQVPGCCSSVDDCSDGEACTLDQCPQAGKLCVHCPAGCPCPDSPPAFSTGFDQGYFVPGWIISDGNSGDNVGWHVSERRWLRPPYSVYVGDPDCGTYSNAPLDASCEPLPLPGTGGTKITTTLKTPTIPLLPKPGGHVALFWVWSEVDALTTGGPGETDVLTVRVEEELTQQSWPVASSLAVGKSTDGSWKMLGADLSPWAGLNVRLNFHFDTLQNLDNLHEGVYLDDLQVVPRCVGGCCSSDIECAGLPIEDGCSQARCVELEGGAGTVCAAVPTKPGELCEPCGTDETCADGNPCTTDVCSEQGICEHAVFCCFEESAFASSFEDPISDFTIGDSNPADGVGWKVTTQSAAVGLSSAWIADEATSSYESDSAIDVSLTTPTLTLPASSDLGGVLGLAFWLNLSTEWDGQLYLNPAGVDRLSVSVVQGPNSTEVWSSDEVGGSTEGTWQPVEVNLEAWAEAPVQLRFSFKSADAINNAYVGPLIDALKVGRICPLE